MSPDAILSDLLWAFRATIAWAALLWLALAIACALAPVERDGEEE